MNVQTFKISGWDEEETGLLIDENEEWVFVRYIPVDYVVDGYKLYKKEFIEERLHSAKEEKIEKVLKLKGIKEDKPAGFKFLSTSGFLNWLEGVYGLFEFQDMDEDSLVYGRINSLKENVLIIDMIKTDGFVEEGYDYKFHISEIRVITFETDYFNSIQLLWEDYNCNKRK